MPGQQAMALVMDQWLAFSLTQQDHSLLLNTRQLLDWLLSSICQAPRTFRTHWSTSPHVSLLTGTIIDLLAPKI